MIKFINPVITHDPKTNLYHCQYSVTGNGNHTTALGVGDDEYQARRNAIAEYRHEHKNAIIKSQLNANNAVNVSPSPFPEIDVGVMDE